MAFLKSEYPASPVLSCAADLDLADNVLGGADHIDLEAVMKAVGILPSNLQPLETSPEATPLPVLDNLELSNLWDSPLEEFLSQPEAAPAAAPAPDFPLTGHQCYQTPTQSYQPMLQQTSRQSYSTNHQSFQMQVPHAISSFPETMQFDANLGSSMTSPVPLLLDLLESSNIVNLDNNRCGVTMQRGPSPVFSDLSSSSDTGFSTSTASSGFYGMSSSSVSCIGNLGIPPAAYSMPVPAAKRPASAKPKMQSATSKKQRVKRAEGTLKSESSQDVCRSSSSRSKASYIEMIARAMMSSPSRRMVLQDIYDYILQHYPYYQTAPNTWRNAVRHNLTVNDCFMKDGREGTGRGFYWAVHPACVEMFSKGDFRRMQARRLAQQMYKNSAVSSAGQAIPAAAKDTTYQQMTYTKVPSAFNSIPSMPKMQHQQSHSQFFMM